MRFEEESQKKEKRAYLREIIVVPVVCLGTLAFLMWISKLYVGQ